jgi:hypothetical protein
MCKCNNISGFVLLLILTELLTLAPCRFGHSLYKGNIGDKITIRAVDDIGMANVLVNISAQNGTSIEAGAAVEDGIRTSYWIYTATKQVPLGSDIFIEIKGRDHSGTQAKMTENPTVGVDE